MTVIPVHRDTPRRIAMLSVHTSPLDQPGTGDAGGMNVYVVELAKRLAELGTEVEIFTRAAAGGLPPVADLAPGVIVRNLVAGPFEGLPKNDLPAQLCAVTAGVLRAEAAQAPGYYDLVHSHYWLSGQVGWLAKERWSVPLVHSMHTMAKVKNLALADGDEPEPSAREIGEKQVVDAADRLVANTDAEANQLIDLYGATREQVAVVAPGVDLDLFSPGDRRAARARLGLDIDGDLLLFVGRIQPLKAPDVVVRAAAALFEAEPHRRGQLTVAIVGGLSGTGAAHPDHLERLARDLGIADRVHFAPPAPHDELVHWYRAATLVAVPSHNESFGLVALEAQACGTPVVAAAVGGLRTSVADGRSGVLIDSHDPMVWADAFGALLADRDRLTDLSAGAVAHAARFGWSATAASMLDVYRGAVAQSRRAAVMSAGGSASGSLVVGS